MAGKNAGLQALVKKKAPHIIWIHSLHHRQALASINMNEELQTVFKVVVRVVNYVRNSPLRRRLFAKLCDNVEINHMALFYCCETWLSCAKVLHRVFELKEKITILLSDSNNSDDANSFYVKILFRYRPSC
jgi:hypothetical protein